MKYLTHFETTQDCRTFQHTTDYDLHNVSFVEDTENVIYSQCLTFKTTSTSGAIQINKIGASSSNLNAQILYAKNNDDWQEYTFDGNSGQVIELASKKDKIRFKGYNSSMYSYSSNGYYNFSMSGDMVGRGDVTSLINGIGGDAPLPNFAFYGLFSGCTSMLKSPRIPSTQLGESCYHNMFKWCSGLKEAPELPATTMVARCYYVMFGNCTFKKAPKMHPTNMATRSWSAMFQNATGLTDVSEITFPDTTAEYCYGNMFRNTSITNTPYLPSTSTTKQCYHQMFNNCHSLTGAQTLPAKTLAVDCCTYMFGGCYNLKAAPYICATTFSTGSCFNMFNGCCAMTTPPPVLFPTVYPQSSCNNMFGYCYSLTATPIMSAVTQIGKNACQAMFGTCPSLEIVSELTSLRTVEQLGMWGMFNYCSSLVSAQTTLPATSLTQASYAMTYLACTSLKFAPSLPATNLPKLVYQRMFNGCTALSAAPFLPAVTLGNQSYSFMFSKCTNLSYIKAMFTTTPGTNFTQNWVDGVKSTGTFVKNSAATWDVRGIHGIPTNWTVETA